MPSSILPLKRLRSSSGDDNGAASSSRYRRMIGHSVRGAKYCIQIGFPQLLCCSGCVEFAIRCALTIDDRDHDDQMAAALSRRHITHRSDRTKCIELWKREAKTLKMKAWKQLKGKQDDFIRLHLNRDPARLVLIDAPRETPRRHLSFDRSNTPDMIAELVTPAPVRNPPQQVQTPPRTIQDGNDVVTSPAKNRQVNFTNHSFKSNGQEFNFDLPNSHKIVHCGYLAKLRADRQKYKQFREVTNLQQFSCREAPGRFKGYLVTALASVPALAVNAAAYLIPIAVTGFLHSFGLLEMIKTNRHYHLSFPSATYLRDAIMSQAADHIVSFAIEVENKNVFIACDKGKHSPFFCWIILVNTYSIVIYSSFQESRKALVTL